ncbi:hypothetical protein [Streptomyces sp. MBT62]|uniref:hypothetical protein n=1 Tax=Streptomyces sp. MBT62 TaxID=2800410 RepID=UPI00190D6001|nr:hypothetical protein [Streptomyces sp. MBT62]MBK3562959.1 hypothetical protein [Streptomyces sp. MBT62]
MTSNRGDWLLFAGWLLTGACYLFALLTVLSIGLFILPLPIVGTVLLATRRGTERGLPGLVSGASLPLFLLTYINRHGPGTYCSNSAGGENCTEGLLNPSLLLLCGILVLAAGVALFYTVRRRHTASPTMGWSR